MITVYPLFGSFRVECFACGAYTTERTIKEALDKLTPEIQAPWTKEGELVCQHHPQDDHLIVKRSFITEPLDLLHRYVKAPTEHQREQSNPKRNVQTGQALYQAECRLKEWGLHQ